MPTLQNNGPYTLVIEFDTEPGSVERLVEGIAGIVDRAFKHDGRFVSANFHVREDGRRMLNYAQWTSKADYEAFMEEMKANGVDEEIGRVIEDCHAKPLGAQVYAVRRTVVRKDDSTLWEKRAGENDDFKGSPS